MFLANYPFMLYHSTMDLRSKKPGVYIQIQDRRRRCRSKGLTVYDVTPAQMKRAIEALIVQRSNGERKAG